MKSLHSKFVGLTFAARPNCAGIFVKKASMKSPPSSPAKSEGSRKSPPRKSDRLAEKHDRRAAASGHQAKKKKSKFCKGTKGARTHGMPFHLFYPVLY